MFLFAIEASFFLKRYFRFLGLKTDFLVWKPNLRFENQTVRLKTKPSVWKLKRSVWKLKPSVWNRRLSFETRSCLNIATPYLRTNANSNFSPWLEVHFYQSNKTIELFVFHWWFKACLLCWNVEASNHKSLLGPICARTNSKFWPRLKVHFDEHQ